MKELFTQELLKEIQASQAKEWTQFWQANDSKNKGE
jgi:hypothetical protein